MQLKYQTHKSGKFVYWSGKTFIHSFFGTMVSTVERLKKALEKEFPGDDIELVPL